MIVLALRRAKGAARRFIPVSLFTSASSGPSGYDFDYDNNYDM